QTAAGEVDAAVTVACAPTAAPVTATPCTYSATQLMSRVNSLNATAGPVRSAQSPDHPAKRYPLTVGASKVTVPPWSVSHMAPEHSANGSCETAVSEGVGEAPV